MSKFKIEKGSVELIASSCRRPSKSGWLLS
jgi:hypothetical protein